MRRYKSNRARSERVGQKSSRRTARASIEFRAKLESSASCSFLAHSLRRVIRRETAKGPSETSRGPFVDSIFQFFSASPSPLFNISRSTAPLAFYTISRFFRNSPVYFRNPSRRELYVQVDLVVSRVKRDSRVRECRVKAEYSN